MSRPIRYFFLAAESYSSEPGKLRVMTGQHPYDHIGFAYEGRYVGGLTLESPNCIITVGTVTDKEGGVPYVYAHKNYPPIIVPKTFARILINDGRLGFTKEARWKNLPKITADEFRRFFLLRTDYPYIEDNYKPNSFDRETVEGQLVDSTYRSVKNAFLSLASEITEPMTYYRAEALRQEIQEATLMLAHVKYSARDIIDAYRKTSGGKTVGEVLGKHQMWDLDL